MSFKNKFQSNQNYFIQKNSNESKKNSLSIMLIVFCLQAIHWLQLILARKIKKKTLESFLVQCNVEWWIV